MEILPSSATVFEVSASIWSLNILIHSIDKAISTEQRELGAYFLPFSTPATVSAFLASALESRPAKDDSLPVAARIIFSSTDGYVIRSDFIEQRLECSQYLTGAKSFLDPLQKVSRVGIDTVFSEPGTFFQNAIGAIALRPGVVSEDLNADLCNRLSFPWLYPDPLSPRRLAWVQGREDIDCIERAFKGALALGVKLVILDEPGHWLQDPDSPWTYLREDFIEVDITSDDGLAARVVEAVRSYPQKIDGIVTISDVRLPAIARACQSLGLPTEIAEAYDIAGDKGRTRLLELVGRDESSVLASAEDLETFLKNRNQQIHFPLVVKPVVGWCSDCVSKVQDVTELRVAVNKASDRHAHSPKPSTAVVVEPYIDGPEVDANFAILNGEILFLDINDDFPSPADEKGATFKANFQETQNVMPSGLPKIELRAIRDQMRDSILRQGFKSGVFHCEARVRNSSVEYASTSDGLLDLVSKNHGATDLEPEVYLHEINARPPGYLESVAVLLTYGIDYYAIRMLLALGPSEDARLRALSQPFLEGPQFHLSLMIIQQTRAGIMKTADAAKEFLDKHPDIRKNVVDYYTRKKGGDVLEGPEASALWWIAYFSVISRVSRRDLLERVEYIQQNFEYEVERDLS